MEERHAWIAMSGGVDSTVAAYLMQSRGYRCTGVTMRLYDGADAERAETCGKPKDIEDARNAAMRLGMPYEVLHCEDAFRREVIDRFVGCYERGLTPNPCMECNRHLKFGALLEHALKMGGDCLATGHYARICRDEETGRYLMYKAVDRAKDQTYFLYMLRQHQLAHVQFPLGTLTKEEVRRIASEQGFRNAGKRDSQDICFVPDGDYAAFLARYNGKAYPQGDFLDGQGRVLGRHRGAVAYTLGQRKGLGLAMGTPVYVCAKDMQKNTVTVGTESELFHRTLYAADWNWFPFETLTEPMRVRARVRYRQQEQPATVYPEQDGIAQVEFDEPQRAMTPGQAVVLYDGERVVGGGTITQVSDA